MTNIIEKIPLLKSGYAGLWTYSSKDSSIIVDRRIIFNSKPVKENKLFNIPVPKEIKKLYNNKVHTLLAYDTKDNTVRLQSRDGHIFWAEYSKVKPYKYQEDDNKGHSN